MRPGAVTIYRTVAGRLRHEDERDGERDAVARARRATTAASSAPGDEPALAIAYERDDAGSLLEAAASPAARGTLQRVAYAVIIAGMIAAFLVGFPRLR